MSGTLEQPLREVAAASPLVCRFDPPLAGTTGPLRGLSFAAQDLFDVAGRRTGFGHPDWAATHAPADGTAHAIDACLRAGAWLVGMAISDELAFSVNGMHNFFVTPPNPVAPGHAPGGSSGGSASAVAAGLVDFALGPDIRAPASHCGVFGFRSSTGLISRSGMLPLAPSFDSVGWFARDAATLARVGTVLVSGGEAPKPLRRLLIAEDALACAQLAVREAAEAEIAALAGHFAGTARITLAEEGLAAWVEVFRVLQAVEAWRCHGAWIERHGARLSPGVRARFEAGRSIDAAMEAAARERMAGIAQRLAATLGDDAALMIPTLPFPPPHLTVPEPSLEPYRPLLLQLTSISGLGGLPQLSAPRLTVGGLPAGLSLLGPAGHDRAVLETAAWLWN